MKAISVYNLKPNYYFATEEGQIISSYQNKPLSLSLDKNGYSRPSFKTKDGKSVRIHAHRLILATYNPIENWENFEVNHIDDKKLNNKPSNLEWVTTKQNILHAWETGLARGGEFHGRATMTESMAMEAIFRHKQGESVTNIAKDLGVGRQAISKIINGDTWKYLPR